MDFKTGKLIGKYDLEKEYKTNKHYQVLHSQAAQQILRTVSESFKSFKELEKKYNKGELHFKPRLPNYRKGNGYALVTYPKQALKLVGDKIKIPLGNTVKRWFKLDSFTIPMPSNLQLADIKELRIIPRNKSFYAELVDEQESAPRLDLNPEYALAIDPGINNWLSCVSNIGTSFIVDGHKVKSLNQWYNKRVSTLKEGKPQGYWDEQLAHITEKRNRQMRDAVNKAAKLVVEHCIKHQIGTVVFGWNQGQRQEATLGKTTQSFVQIPTAKLKERVKQLCEYHGIKFVETEESYTSKASFLDGDFLPTYGEKPVREASPKEITWKPSGKRVKRGMYRTRTGKLINADLNGAANILRLRPDTTRTQPESCVCRQVLTLCTRIRIWETKTKKRSGTDGCLPLRNSLESPCIYAGERSNQQIARQRKQWHFELAGELVDKALVIFVEDLKVSNMSRRNQPKQDESGNFLHNGQAAKSGLNKSFADAGIAGFLNEILPHKAAKAGRSIVKVNPAGTSQHCAVCLNKVPKQLSDRWHECSCGASMPRDLNSGILIKKVGLGVRLTIKRESGKSRRRSPNSNI